MAKISGLITDRDREIAVRVRKVRYSNQLSQPAFARSLSVSIDRLASIEYARTPLSVELADKIASKFDVSLSWLANGGGPMKPSIGTILPNCPNIKASDVFSASYSPQIREFIFEVYKFRFASALTILLDAETLPKGKAADSHLVQLQEWLSESFRGLPHEGKAKLMALMVRTLSRFDLDWELGRREHPGQLITTPKKTELTDAATYGKLSAVKAQLPSLLDRLNRATSESGKMSELADYLGKVTGKSVPLASVSRWLSGKREPGGEITLMLLHWVERQERQK